MFMISYPNLIYSYVTKRQFKEIRTVNFSRTSYLESECYHLERGLLILDVSEKLILGRIAVSASKR